MKRYEFINEHAERYPVRMLTGALEVSSSGFYDWRDRPMSARGLRRTEIEEAVTEVYIDQEGIPGSRKIQEALEKREFEVCRNTVSDVMQRNGLISRAQRHRAFVVTTDSNHKDPVARNVLKRDFTADAPSQKWVADITYVRTEEG